MERNTEEPERPKPDQESKQKIGPFNGMTAAEYGRRIAEQAVEGFKRLSREKAEAEEASRKREAGQK
jgi:hypothetical protein